MPEDQKENVQDVVQPEAGEVVDNTLASQQEQSQEVRPTSEEHNWRETRETLRQYKRRIAELEDRLDQKNKSKESEKIDDPFAGLSNEDLVTVGDTKKMFASEVEKVANKVYDGRQKKDAIERVPSQFSDYNEIIKLVDEYVKENPAAEAAIRSSPNPRLSAYQMVKSSTLYQKKMSQKDNQDNVQKAIDNSKKPVSSQSLGTTSPLNDMNKYEKMTPTRAAEVRKMAEEFASRR